METKATKNKEVKQEVKQEVAKVRTFGTRSGLNYIDLCRYYGPERAARMLNNW